MENSNNMPNRSAKIEKILTPAQKVIVFGTLAVAILLFIYSFIFMTPFADIYQIDGQFLFERMARFGITQEYLYKVLPDEAFYIAPISGDTVGINLAYFTSFTKNELQVLNQWLFTFGFITILVSLIPFIYFSQKRKIYYKTNMIAMPVVAGFNIYVGVHMFVQLVTNHTMVLSDKMTIGYKLMNAYQTYINNPDLIPDEGKTLAIKEYFKQSGSNGMFVFGYILAILLIGLAIASCVLVVVKYFHQKKQPPVDFSQIHINE